MNNRFLNRLAMIAAGIIMILGAQSCHDTPDYKDTLYGNFDALSDIVATRYCFLQEKGLDWKAISDKYRAQLKPDMGILEEFQLYSNLLDELKDGHVNLVSRFNTSYYRKWWTDYPQDFNLRTLQENYLQFDYMQTSGISYKMMPDTIGYLYYPSFSAPISETGLDYILAILHNSKGLIIDIRDNGGGLLTNINTLFLFLKGTPGIFPLLFPFLLQPLLFRQFLRRRFRQGNVKLTNKFQGRSSPHPL